MIVLYLTAGGWANPQALYLVDGKVVYDAGVVK